MSQEEIFATRRNNLRLLIGRSSSKELAERLQHTNASYLAQLAGPNPSRGLSEKGARKFEQLLDLPKGWLDQNNDRRATPAPAAQSDEMSDPDIDADRLAQCLEIAQEVCDAKGLTPTPRKFADLVVIAYYSAGSLAHIRDSVARMCNLMS